ncbi:hypothetical protein [Microbacterium sp.]|uniref:hypothetical protein n=1 Tax=Microbacterium sp. TaxID=51671 RepID=UPI0028111478|nr:hypothetical protein [Microbacterium sp.]
MTVSTAGTCPPDHPHNTTCYLRHQCRCAACKTFRAATERTRRREQAYGTYTRGRVDVAPVREHIQWLRSQGMGPRRIAAVSGVPYSAICRIVWGQRRDGERMVQSTIASTTAQVLLAVRPELNVLADHALIDATGYRRRLQALMAHGWSLPAIVRALPDEATELQLRPWVYATRITAANARTIVSIFDRLELATPPQETPQERAIAQRTRRFAARHRWAPALAWDDIDTDPTPPAIDQPAGDPLDEIAIELALAGRGVRLTPGERRVCVRKLHTLRWSDPAIAERLRCASKTVERIREELGLDAWPTIDQEVTRAAA